MQPAADAMPIESSLLNEGRLAAAVLGAGLPGAAEAHLRAAGQAYHRDDVAEWHLREAQASAPDHAAVLIGLYRFYFYKNRLPEALEIARLCLRKSAADNHLPADWRAVGPHDADFASYESVLPRFFLFTLKGYAYLQMRLGNLAEGRAAVMKLLELDPGDKMGARVLEGILDRGGKGDDE
jgi:tetratricopeptide (TPR) repeat protein